MLMTMTHAEQEETDADGDDGADNDGDDDDDDDEHDDDDDIYIMMKCVYVCLSRFCLFCLPPAKLMIYIYNDEVYVCMYVCHVFAY